MDAVLQILKAKQAVTSMSEIGSETVRNVLIDLAQRVDDSTENLIAANALDLEQIPAKDLWYDRLMLNRSRIADITKSIRQIAAVQSPVGEVVEERTAPGGLFLKKIRVPIGLIGAIYEARPCVTFNMFSLCFKSGNVVILKGGKEATFSNQSIVSMIKKSLIANGISPDIVQLLSSDRKSVQALMNATGLVDVLIARGSQELINSVRIDAKIPVIEAGAGVVHIYFDETGDLETGRNVVLNAKTQCTGESSTLECFIIHGSRLNALAELIMPLSSSAVEIEADPRAFQALEGKYPRELLHPAKGSSFGTEFLDYRMAIKTVDSIEEAISHISTYGTKHSEAIIASSEKAISTFFGEVDASTVCANTSTLFTGRDVFGMDMETGISTQKLHARGPMGLKELTACKWLVRGNGAIHQA